jgi:hypothetical protein
VKSKIDGVNKAIAERFGERTLLTNAAREPSRKLFNKAAYGLAATMIPTLTTTPARSTV